MSLESKQSPKETLVYVVDTHCDHFSDKVHIIGLRKDGNSDRTVPVHVAVNGVFPHVFCPFPPQVKGIKTQIEFTSLMREYCDAKLKTNYGSKHVLSIAMVDMKRAYGFRNGHTSPMMELTLSSPWAVKVVGDHFTAHLKVGKFDLPTGIYVYNHMMPHLEISRRYNVGIGRWNKMQLSELHEFERNEEEKEASDNDEEDYDLSSKKRKRTQTRDGDDGEENEDKPRKRKEWKRPNTISRHMENYKCKVDQIVDTGDKTMPRDMRILTYDIETNGLDKETCQVYQIVGVVSDLTGKVIRAVGFFMHCSPEFDEDVKKSLENREAMMGVKFEMRKFDNEKKMIRAFWDFAMRESLMISDFNGKFFDLPFLIHRDPDLPLGRFSTSRSKNQQGKFFSEFGAPKLEGVPHLDMLLEIKKHPKHMKLDMFTLDFVVKNVLKKVLSKEDLGKDDVPFQFIKKAFEEDIPKDCGKVLVYCLWDVLLTMLLMHKTNIALISIATSNNVSMPLSGVVSTKNEPKVCSRNIKRFMERGYVMNIPYRPKVYGESNAPEGSDEKYQGATVMQPVPGFHKGPIPSLDFNSLYPNCMLANFMCISTKLASNVNIDDPNIRIITAPHNPNIRFAYNITDPRLPVIPEILKENMDRRKEIKEQMKKYPKDSFEYAQSDGEQEAVKLESNATYGVIGFKLSVLYDEDIASTVTAFGRQNIKKAMDITLKEYNTTEEPDNVYIVYGDTDSIMIGFHERMIERHLPTKYEFPRNSVWNDDEFMERRRIFASQKLVRPLEEKIKKETGITIKNEGAKINMGLPDKKKKYFCSVIENVFDPKDKSVKLSGIDVVRRDQPGFVRNDLKDLISNLAMNGNFDAMIEGVKVIAEKICTNKDDYDYFVATEGFSRDDFKNPEAQISVQVRNRMAKIMKDNVPQLKDRIPYVIVRGPHDGVASNARHILEMKSRKEGTLKGQIEEIDITYYLEILSKKVDCIFSCIEEINKPVQEHLDGLIQRLKPKCRQLTGQTRLTSWFSCRTPVVATDGNDLSSPSYNHLNEPSRHELFEKLMASQASQNPQTSKTFLSEQQPSKRSHDSNDDDNSSAKRPHSQSQKVFSFF